MSGNIYDFNVAKINRLIANRKLDGKIIIDVFLSKDGSYVLDYHSDYNREDMIFFFKSILISLEDNE